MIQQVGKKDVELSEFQKIFGVSYENLDKDERYYFLTLLALKHSLYTFSKRKFQSNLFILHFRKEMYLKIDESFAKLLYFVFASSGRR
jgi:hypothetical protein